MSILQRLAISLFALTLSGAAAFAADAPKGGSPVQDSPGKVAVDEADLHYGKLYAQARALYREGPARAPEIIKLLKEQIRLTPDNEQAIYLLGVTYFGTNDMQNALQQFDQGIALSGKRGEINAEVLFYKARTLFYLGRCTEAKQMLDAYSAFWQDGGRLQGRYEQLYPEVERQCGGKMQ